LSQSTCVTDGQTDGQTDGRNYDSQDCTSIAVSHGKNPFEENMKYNHIHYKLHNIQ